MSLSAHEGHARPTLHLAPPATARLQTTALGVGVIAVLGAAVLGFFGDGQFFQSYLMAFLFWLGLSLGALVLLFTQHLAGGPWGPMIARPLESAATLVPLMALLFVPVLIGARELYVWTDPAYVAGHPTVAAKSEYLNMTWFVIRAVVYFVVWTAAALVYRRTSLRQDEEQGKAAGTLAMRLRSAAGMWFVFYVLTMTFAAIDWAMSLTPVWFSGIYPVIIMASQAITAIAFAILAITWLAARNPSIDALLTPRRLQDLGNFLLAFTMFWAYTQVSQLIIQWSNNVAETATWYVVRLGPGWVGLAAWLLFFGFFAPFFVLFSRWVKRKRRALSIVAVWALVTQALNYFWFLAPTFGREGFALTLADVLVFIGIGGIWLAAFARQLGSQQVLPANDPRLIAAVSSEHHG